MFRIIGSGITGVIILLNLASLAAAQSHEPVRVPAEMASQRHRIQQISGGGLGLVRSLRDGTPHILIAHPGSGNVVVPASDLAERARVRQALDAHSAELSQLVGLPVEAELHCTGVDSTRALWHATYSISYHGIPVRDRKLSVNIGKTSGKYVSLINELPIKAPTRIEPSVEQSSLDAAHLADWIGTGTNITVTSPPTLVYSANGLTGDLLLCYDVVVRDSINAHLWRLTIDAASGDLIEQKDLLEYVTLRVRTGRVVTLVHPQSPFDSVRRVGAPQITLSMDGSTVVTDSEGYWSLTCMDTSQSAVVQFANSNFFVSRADSGYASLVASLDTVSNVLELNDLNSRASERDAFYSIAAARRFAQCLTHEVADPDSIMIARVDLSQACNAFYDPSDHSLNFFRSSNSCSNTAEIADVVYHEFGHRWIHSIYANSASGNIVNSSLGEAFADIFSAFERDDSRIGIGFFTNNSYSILRDCFNTKSFPKDVSGDPHTTGQILSGCFWDLRRSLGRTLATRIFTDALRLHPDAPNSTLSQDIETGVMETLMDVLAVDDTDNDLTNGTPHLGEILTAFGKHGVSLANFIELATSHLPDFDSAAMGYPITVRANYTGQIGEISDTSLWAYYSFNNGQSYSRVNLKPGADSLFTGRIPATNAGTVVRYYVKASTTLDTVGAAYDPQPSAPAVFLVGYHRHLLDDAENDRGWTLAAPSDKAKTGLWIRDIPYGTYQTPGSFIQQDTDHTATGVACYVTGNKLTRSFSEDDVDSGAATLMTPALDLTSAAAPVIRYWYYYWNKYGFYANRAPFVVQVSSDDGSSWKTVQSTADATDGWASYTFRVSDRVTPTATTRLRFIAADYFATVIEAGVDDLEILSAPANEVSSVNGASRTEFDLIIARSSVRRNQRAVLQLHSDRERHVVVQVKNIFGDPISTPLDQAITQGVTTTSIDLHDLAAGHYWIVASDGREQRIKRLIVE